MLSGDYEVVLDDSYMGEGIELGDIIKDATTGLSLTVVGFTKDALYGHTPAGYITMGTYEAIRAAINPSYQLSYQTIALHKDGGREDYIIK
ncbi:MAG: hypothetical protein E7256_04490 [Lachnospiraceae bacterium]|nr:hypothetical protein [Lachnospiraceae bacterium]